MSMTESEAIEYLSNRYLVVGSPVNPPKEECEKHNAVMDMAITALSEIQQYRAIGTVSELRELKEKATAKKPIETDWLRCPNCNATLLLGEKHCICGQKLDWSEGKE